MVRRIASQVHKQAARLMRVGYLKQEPVWFQAVLDHPPLSLPPKAPPARPDHERKLERRRINPSTILRPPKNSPLPIFYLEDEVRRQFFRDHPFESFRAVSLVEDANVESEHPIQGKEWTRLRQRGRNPSAEDAIRFAVNLHQNHDMSLSSAYARAVAQFRSLRAEHETATSAAKMEAEAYGTVFPSETDRSFEKEEKQLYSEADQKALDRGALIAQKRWKAILDVQSGMGGWSRGQDYMNLWQQGVRPSFTQVPDGALGTSEMLQEEERLKIQAERSSRPPVDQVDFMGVRRAAQ